VTDDDQHSRPSSTLFTGYTTVRSTGFGLGETRTGLAKTQDAENWDMPFQPTQHWTTDWTSVCSKARRLKNAYVTGGPVSLLDQSPLRERATLLNAAKTWVLDQSDLVRASLLSHSVLSPATRLLVLSFPRDWPRLLWPRNNQAPRAMIERRKGCVEDDRALQGLQRSRSSLMRASTHMASECVSVTTTAHASGWQITEMIGRRTIGTAPSTNKEHESPRQRGQGWPQL